MTNMRKPLSYKSSGVDISAANRFVEAIKADVKKTHTKAVIHRKGSFGALYTMPASSGQSPVLVSSTDGVGTKLLLAKELGVHHTVGIDLVAMNINDILCVGAKPLFFLDYIACGQLKPNVLKDVVKGIAKGCQLAGCSLIGGETAEMPGMYKQDDYDLAGFAVGVVDKKNILDGSKIKKGDILIGLPSSGFHSNGYSLIRKVFKGALLKKYAKEILKPTKIYTREVMGVLSTVSVKGIAHITGGAYYDKLTKMLPNGLCFNIDCSSWNKPEVFKILQQKGKITDEEMYRTFNMGIGIVFVVHPKELGRAKNFFKRTKTRYAVMGSVVPHRAEKVLLNFNEGDSV
ncbi:MAG: phosphoribosylformylglycinamidine cyclo-ligase [Candidatus Omnitrophica bacterium]|nr:phosphoribosylformylglycinamidine cyclo-ligase [Candidatus Omnitrophota bacterium]